MTRRDSLASYDPVFTVKVAVSPSSCASVSPVRPGTVLLFAYGAWAPKVARDVVPLPLRWAFGRPVLLCLRLTVQHIRICEGISTRDDQPGEAEDAQFHLSLLHRPSETRPHSFICTHKDAIVLSTRTQLPGTRSQTESHAEVSTIGHESYIRCGRVKQRINSSTSASCELEDIT